MNGPRDPRLRPEVPVGSQLDTLISDYTFARTAHEQAKAEVKPYKQAEDAAEAALFEYMEGQNLRSARHAQHGLVMLSDIAEAQITDAVALVKWAEQAMPEILTANRQRLGVIVRDILKGDREPVDTTTPEGLPPGVSFYLRRSINWRRGS